jgi:hypothetical protein
VFRSHNDRRVLASQIVARDQIAARVVRGATSLSKAVRATAVPSEMIVEAVARARGKIVVRRSSRSLLQK